MTRSVVVGGGPAGIALALALHAAGADCTVHERDGPPEADGGQLVRLGPSGLDALRAIGVTPPGIAVSRLLSYSGTGKPIGEVANGTSGRRGPPGIIVDRHSFHRDLYEAAARRGVRFVHGSALVTCSVDGSSVAAEFSDGARVECDALVGADGARSTTRRTMAPDAPGPIRSGVLGLGGRARAPGVAPTPDAMVAVFGWAAFFAYHVEPMGEIHWMAFVPRPDAAPPAAEPEPQLVEWLRGVFARDAGQVQEVLHGIRGPVDVHPVFDVADPGVWSRGPVALIGDAARTATPRIAMGISLAVEDAVVVAKCLRDVPDPTRALATYESLRRTRVQKVIRWGSWHADQEEVGAFGMWLRNATWPLAFRAARGRTDWIHDHQLNWSEPIG